MMFQPGENQWFRKGEAVASKIGAVDALGCNPA
jgi:hypothetical protein